MRFLDNLGKSLSSGVERAKYEADKFQRTSKISGEISNFKSQIDTNMRQLGERALELYQQGAVQAPEIASLAQIISQLREQQDAKERELEAANTETFEQFQAAQPQEPAPQPDAGQSIPIARMPEDSTFSSSTGEGSFPTPTAASSNAYPDPSDDLSGSGQPNPASTIGVDAHGTTPYACPSCGYALPEGAVFCPNCGARAAGQ